MECWWILSKFVADQTLKKYDTGKNLHVPNKILCNSADLNQHPVWERSLLEFQWNSTAIWWWCVCKSLEAISCMILNWKQPKFEAKLRANDKQSLKVINRPAFTWPLQGAASIFNSKIFEQSGAKNNNPLCYWPTIYNPIPKICPIFQVLSSHLSECVKRKYFQIHSIMNVIICINKGFAVKSSGVSCLKRKIQQADHWFKLASYDRSYFFFYVDQWTYDLVVEASSFVSVNIGSMLAGCWKSLLPLGCFVLHWASQQTVMSTFILLCTL